MTMHPDALDRIVEAEPYAAVRARYAELASDDRPGDPYHVPFDARRRPRLSLFLAVTGLQFAATALAVFGVWAVLS